jgi:hypothetical protein
MTTLAGIHKETIGEVIASIPQMAILNTLLPRGFRFEPFDNVRRLNASTAKSLKSATAVIYLLNCIDH